MSSPQDDMSVDASTVGSFTDGPPTPTESTVFGDGTLTRTADLHERIHEVLQGRSADIESAYAEIANHCATYFNRVSEVVRSNKKELLQNARKYSFETDDGKMARRNLLDSLAGLETALNGFPSFQVRGPSLPYMYVGP